MADRSFPKARAGYPFPELEAEVLEFWQHEKIFQRSVERNAGGPSYVFYEGPPTANNVPHVGHVVTRVVKDLFPRYRTMQGDQVLRKAGWDTHGLPVEIEVEKALGFSGKEQIEAFGIAEFNARCFDSVQTYERQWRAMSERVGYWTDFDNPYLTYSNQYIESVWSSLRALWDKGLLSEGYKIQPYCARCGTTLSSHEVAQNYQETDDPSVWVLFPLRQGQSVEVDGRPVALAEALHLVAWTTTPWTLTGHTGLAVNTGLNYKVVADPAGDDRQFLIGDQLETPIPYSYDLDGERVQVDLGQQDALMTIRGSELAGLRYDRPFATPFDPSEQPGFDPSPNDQDGWVVFTADYVTRSEGTGIVHTAPAYGADDYQSGTRYGLPFALTVDGEGKMMDLTGMKSVAGMWFKDADKILKQELKERGLLLASATYRHNYPFCWRCDTPLLYYASKSWFVLTTQRAKQLVKLNKTIGWRPAHVGEGRFGNWLENVVDWALSRKRYWGTPLPVWTCNRCDHVDVVGSFQDLFRLAEIKTPDDLHDREQFDPHRPFVDRYGDGNRFVWACPDCHEGTVGRVDDVIDAWYDSGSMPFAQHHYLPHLGGDQGKGFDPTTGVGFPADFISEAIDQTRGWFYTLHALGTLLFDSVAYRNCVVLGHVNDETGRKMSKRLGNVVEPMQVIEKTGADAIRWYFCVNNPTVNSRFSERLVREAAQKFLLPLWNAVSFFSIYANLDQWHPDNKREGTPSTLDDWILSRLQRLLTETSGYLDNYRVAEAARGVETFLDELTNWYIRRSRKRFWAGDSAIAGEAATGETAALDGADKEAAYQTLYRVLTTLAHVVAPFTPFVAEVLHRNLIRSQRDDCADSVHLESWPQHDPTERNDDLELAIGDLQRIVRLGHAARNSHGLKTRQPLRSVTVIAAESQMEARVAPYVDLLCEELNVSEVSWAEDRSKFVEHQIRPNFPKLGPRLGKNMPMLKKALEAADGDQLAQQLERDGEISVAVADQTLILSNEEVEVVLNEREGIATEGDRELLVVLDSDLDQGLVDAGRAREVVHRLQTVRKNMDLEYADRIVVAYSADAELERAIDAHRDWIAGETLTVSWTDDPGPEAVLEPVDELEFRFAIRRQTVIN